jgi:tyrosinase
MSTGALSPQHPAVPVRHRLNIDQLSSQQLTTFRSAMSKAQGISDDRGYTYQAGIHGLPLPMSCDIAHGRPIFLPWHRAYLYSFELRLRDQAPDVTLPWWDWTTDRRVPESYREGDVGGQPNPLFSAKVDPLAVQQGAQSGDQRGDVTSRAPGAAGAPPLPTGKEVADVLALPAFLDFTHQLEQLHNNVHVWVGGHMSDIPYAAFDPIFWAHHTMIDRVWRMWQLRHPSASFPQRLLGEALPPFGLTVRETLDANTLGYDYAVRGSTASGTGPGKASG